LYQIQAQHLHAAGGQVRCASCRTTFVATDAVFDDPAQALAYAEKRHVERDIEALVSRALEQVPGSQEPKQAAEGAPPWPSPDEERDALHPSAQQAAAIPPGEDLPSFEDRAEPGAPVSAAVPEDTQDSHTQSPTGEPVSGGSEPDAEPWVEAPNDDRVATARDESPHQQSAPLPGVEDAAEAATVLPVTRYADLDLQAQPLAAEFVRPRQPRHEPGSTVPSVLLLEDEYHHRVSHRAWGAIAAALLLTALLVAQYGYVERYRLASVPQLRPLLETGCRLLGCELPLRREIAQVEIVEREVRDHPKVADALLISAAFVNRADFVQPFPVFSVSFSDVSGTLLAARRFRPDEYLSDSQKAARGMQPGERAQLMLEVVDPGDSAVSFQFDFL